MTEPHELRTATVAAVGLTVLGAVLGLAWSAWSGPQQRAYVIKPGQLYPYDEVETMAAADGRYLVIVAVVGLGAGLLAWRQRAVRGPAMVVGLCAGGLAGAALTWWVGHLSGGGTYAGKPGSTIAQLPLTLHMTGLVFVEAALAALIYGILAAFAARDDLGRPDPTRQASSVAGGDDPERAGGDGDAATALQQDELPPQ